MITRFVKNGGLCTLVSPNTTLVSLNSTLGNLSSVSVGSELSNSYLFNRVQFLFLAACVFDVHWKGYFVNREAIFELSTPSRFAWKTTFQWTVWRVFYFLPKYKRDTKYINFLGIVFFISSRALSFKCLQLSALKKILCFPGISILSSRGYSDESCDSIGC